MPHNGSEAVSLGTTIIAASYNGGVILGADTRTSTGKYVANRAAGKLTQIAENVYVCRSGSAADTQAVAGHVQYYIAQHQAEAERQLTVANAANLCMQIVYSNKSALSCGMLIAGWDEDAGGSVFALPMGGTLLKVPYGMGGSGSAYITGFCDKNYRQNMTEAECRDFVTRSVAHAMARDGSSGGCTRLVIIDKGGAREEFMAGNLVRQHGGEHGVPLWSGFGDGVEMAT